MQKSDLKIAYKLETKHLDVKGPERQRVSLAALVFSNSSAEAIRFCGLNGYLDEESEKCEDYEDCADFLKLINDWFDILNSKRKYGFKRECNSYGLDLEYQNSILNLVTDTMKSMKMGKHRSLLLFQKGIILTNTSLQQLFPYLEQKYGHNFDMSYIMTARHNQDILENFFSYIRAMVASRDKPSALQFKYRLKWYI